MLRARRRPARRHRVFDRTGAGHAESRRHLIRRRR